jgi:hypothetical protein
MPIPPGVDLTPQPRMGFISIVGLDGEGSE